MDERERPLVARGWRLGSVVEGEVDIPARNERARMVCIPVRCQGEMVAVLTRESALTVGRRPGELERTYVEVFDRIARMISAGDFPFPVDEEATGEMPRVGDGVLVLDAASRVEFASPNAVNALHRMGLYTLIDGLRLDEAGLGQACVDLAFRTKLPATEEIVRDADAAVVIRCVPLIDQGRVTGAVVLLRDVTELRRRDRLLLSKDAAIREVHHRVKNNLQTISSLLRLQSRRLPPGEGREALQESERRVRSIALVHEILSRDTVDQVHFNDILPSLMRMAEDLGSPDRPVHITSSGDAGDVPASVATPLAVVVTELLQNAAEHAFGPDGDGGDGEGGLQVDVRLERTGRELVVRVSDNGVGLPDGFDIEQTSSLGLSLVRGLIGTQLGGRISMYTDAGTVVELAIPLDQVDDDLESI
jgi:two-component sensor histidine kinase